MKSRVGTRNETTRAAWLETVLMRIPAGSRILDAGAGEQQYAKYCSHLAYVSQDIAQYDGRGDSRGLHTGSWESKNLDIVSDIASIPEMDASFDAVMCTEVFEHLADPLLALREFSRLLKKGGKLILTAPFCSLTHFAPYYFYSGFAPYFYRKHLPILGFDILQLETNGNFFEYMAQEIRRSPKVAEQYAKDRLLWWESLSLRIILRMLERFSGRDNGSSDLLHFGCLVLAEKVQTHA